MLGSVATGSDGAPPRPSARIHFTQRLYDAFTQHLMSGADYREEGAYLACDTLRRGQQVELYVQAFEPAPRRPMTLSSRHISAHPGFIAGALNYGGRTHASIIVAHSHPFAGHDIAMTPFDLEGEADLVPRLQRRVPGAHHGTAIFGRSGILTRCFAPESRRPLQAELVIEPDRERRAARLGSLLERRRLFA